MDITLLIVVILVIMTAVVIATILAYGYANRCPKCGRWWARIFEVRKEIKREQSMRVMTRHDIKDGEWTMDGYGSRKPIYTASVTTENQYRCRRCDQRWAETVTSGYDGLGFSESVSEYR